MKFQYIIFAPNLFEIGLKVSKYFYKSKNEPTFRRKVVTLIGVNMSRCLIAYYYDELSQPQDSFQLQPHGNSKFCSNSYNRTEESTLDIVIINNF